MKKYKVILLPISSTATRYSIFEFNTLEAAHAFSERHLDRLKDVMEGKESLMY